MKAGGPEIILASRSPVRAKLLRAAGVPVRVVAAPIDETAIIAAMVAAGEGPDAVALRLASLKALKGAGLAPGALVIGADQVLLFEGRIHEKAGSADAARAELRRLRGRRAEFRSAVALARGGDVLWTHVGEAAARYRSFSDGFLEQYVAENPEAASDAVGCVEIEAVGIQLLEELEGDHATLLGLPLLPLLAALRRLGALPS